MSASVEQGLMCCAANTPRKNDDHRPTEHNKLLFLLVFNLDLYTSCPALTILTSFREERGRKKEKVRGRDNNNFKKTTSGLHIYISRTRLRTSPRNTKYRFTTPRDILFSFLFLFLLSEGVTLSQFTVHRLVIQASVNLDKN